MHIVCVCGCTVKLYFLLNWEKSIATLWGLYQHVSSPEGIHQGIHLVGYDANRSILYDRILVSSDYECFYTRSESRWHNCTTPKKWLSKGHDKPIHGSCAIYFPSGTNKSAWTLFDWHQDHRWPSNSISTRLSSTVASQKNSSHKPSASHWICHLWVFGICTVLIVLPKSPRQRP